MTTLQSRHAEPTLLTTSPVVPDAEELVGRLAAHTVAAALVRKSVIDPVPFPVWWRVADALRASLVLAPADAVAGVDEAAAALRAHVDGLPAGPSVILPPSEDVGRALRYAQVLVARLVLTAGPTSPTLLNVRLARLRRTLVAAAD
jgi:hypothetical protein